MEGVKQWFSDMNASGPERVQVLKDQGINLPTDVTSCNILVNLIKSSILKDIPLVPTPFNGGPAMPLIGGSIGERVWNNGVGSAIKVDGSMCRFIFWKSRSSRPSAAIRVD